MLMQRPSKRELYKKIKQGQKLVELGNILLINPNVIAEDAIELSYRIENLQRVLYQLFDEIEIGHYVGAHPPRKSYETMILKCELFEFKWKCKKFGSDIYIKYCLKEESFFLVSLHKDRPKEP